MGYNSRTTDSHIAFKVADALAMFEILKGIALKTDPKILEYYEITRTEVKCDENTQKTIDLLEALVPHGFNGDIIDGKVRMAVCDSQWKRDDGDHEKEQAVWKALAPYINNGSHIECEDDDGNFRWYFNNGKLYFQTGNDWPEPTQEEEVTA